VAFHNQIELIAVVLRAALLSLAGGQAEQLAHHVRPVQDTQIDGLRLEEMTRFTKIHNIHK
jgi:hypothetical protein